MKKIFDEEFKTTLSKKIDNAKAEYKYQPELTIKLDNYRGDFTKTTLLEIVLWKINRYPTITEESIIEINDLRKSYTEEKAVKLVKKLLETKGFDLPMASTLLRFASPEHFQIIDQRVYRFITPDKEKLSLSNNIEIKIDLYFDYLRRLREVCNTFKIPFKESDRILYQLDKSENKEKPIH